MQKWNISTYRAQRVDEKNDVICVVMFTSKVMVIRMWKKASFNVYSAEYRKTDQVWARYLNASVRSYLALLQNAMDYGVLTYN